MSSHGVPSAGKRRIDRVLADGYLAGLRDASLDEVRGLRGEAEQEEVDLSYLRRLLQGRVDVLRAELARRNGPDTGDDLVHGLARILAEERRTPARGSGRHSAVEPTRVADHRRRPEALVADTDLSDITARSDEDVRRVLEVLSDEERSLSDKRRRVQMVMDACSGEITRRYRDGEADVDTLLLARTGPEG